MSNEGYVFALLSCPYKGMIKIDKTKEKPEERVKELSKSNKDSVVYIIAYEIFVSDFSSAEEYLKSLLDSSGYFSKDQKFYEIKLKNLVPLMMKVKNKFEIKEAEYHPVENSSLQDYDRFGFPELNSVRTIKNDDGTICWFGEDLVKILKAKDINTIKEKLSVRDYIYSYINKDDEHATFLVEEFGLYKLLLDSRNDESKQFRSWLINKVLPSLFREGEYAVFGSLKMDMKIKISAGSSDITRYYDHVITLSISCEKFDNYFKSFMKSFDSKLTGDNFLELKEKLKTTNKQLKVMFDDMNHLVDYFSGTILENHIKAE